MRYHYISTKQKIYTRGFTLIEVLVSFFLLSIALMALLKLDQSSIEETRTLLWQAIALTELDSGLSLTVLADANAWSNWQSHISDVLPLAKINYVPPDNLEITWQLPKQQTPSSVHYQAWV